MRARNQILALACFGFLLCLSAALLALAAGPTSRLHTVLTFTTPAVGLAVLGVAARRLPTGVNPVGDEHEERPGAYLVVFAGGSLLALVLVSFDPDPWVVPTVLAVLALIVAYLASVERSTVGTSTALATAVQAIIVGLVEMTQSSVPGSVTVAAAVGTMLLAAAVTLGMGNRLHRQGS